MPVRALGSGLTGWKEGLWEPDPRQPPRGAELQAGGRICPHHCPFHLPRPTPPTVWLLAGSPWTAGPEAPPPAPEPGKAVPRRGAGGSSVRVRVSFEAGVQRRLAN